MVSSTAGSEAAGVLSEIFSMCRRRPRSAPAVSELCRVEPPFEQYERTVWRHKVPNEPLELWSVEVGRWAALNDGDIVLVAGFAVGPDEDLAFARAADLFNQVLAVVQEGTADVRPLHALFDVYERDGQAGCCAVLASLWWDHVRERSRATRRAT